MSGLSFISEYTSESDSDSDCQKNKRFKLPTPDLSGVSVVVPETHVDDPLKHGGRSRSFPHVRGNWATYVYVKYSHEEFLLTLTNKLEKVLLSQNESWQKCSDVHISLSKTFTVPYHLIVPFTSNLQKVLSGTESFELEFSDIKVYCNEERTRTFIALAVDHYCYRNLLSLSHQVDEILLEYNLPKFYEDPSFHMSIFWITGDKSTEVNKILNELNNIVLNITDNKIDLIEKVYCKSGNKFFQYQLL